MIEKSHSRGLYEEARSIFLSFQAKGKLAIEETSPETKLLKVVPKVAEVQSVKIYTSQGDEQTMEQMVLMSAINL